MYPGRLSEHFERWEFACPCGCGKDTVDAELIKVLEDLRARLGGHKITVSSGCRCVLWNATKEVGGSVGSKHIVGKAADIVVENVSADIVADCMDDKYPGRYGIGRYDWGTHIDVRVVEARWDKRNYG